MGQRFQKLAGHELSQITRFQLCAKLKCMDYYCGFIRIAKYTRTSVNLLFLKFIHSVSHILILFFRHFSQGQIAFQRNGALLHPV